MLPEPLRPKQPHSIPGPHRLKLKFSRAVSGQIPVNDPHAEMEIKPRGRVVKEEDPKPPHQLYKLQVKSTRSTRQTLCLWNIYKGVESSHKENALARIAVDIGGKNTQE